VLIERSVGPELAAPGLNGFWDLLRLNTIFRIINNYSVIIYIYFKKTCQFINVVNSMIRSHKTAITFFPFDSVA